MESRSIIDSIKEQIQYSGNAYKDFFNIRGAGDKCRIRFLENLDKAVEIIMHAKWKEIDHPCLTYYGKKCPNCDNPDAKDQKFYALNVYNYETKKVEIFFYKVSKASPLQQLCMIYENHEPKPSITYCDLVIQRNGTGFDTSYSIIESRRGKFVNPGGIKKFTKDEIFDLVLKAHNQTGISPGDFVKSDDVLDDDDVPFYDNVEDGDEDEYEEVEDWDDDDEAEEEFEEPKRKPATRKRKA